MCGIVGIVANSDVNQTLYDALNVLPQNRRKEVDDRARLDVALD